MKQDRFLVALTEGEWDKVEFFKEDIEPEVWAFTKSFYDRTGRVPEYGVLKERFPFLQTPSNTPYQFYKEEREKELFVQRATPVLERFNEEQKDGFSSALLRLRDGLEELKAPKDLQGHSLKRSVEQRIESFTVSAPQRLRTGIEPLDAATGGLERDEFFIISARLGIGKSWVGQFIAANVAKQGKTVLFYSGEMTEEQVGSRIDTIWAEGAISNFLYTRNRLTEEEKAVLKEKVSQVQGDIIVFTPKDLPTSSCRPSDVGRFMRLYNPDVVILDQISLMEPDGKRFSSDQERKAELSYQLKILQERSPVPFILISQLNRAAQTEEATAANIAGSDRIGQDASLVIALKRREDRLRISILKARSFAPQDGPMEFVWDVDRGSLTPALSGMDAVRARAQQARQRDERDSRQEDTADELSEWEE